MAPSCKFNTKNEKDGIKHSPFTSSLSHGTPCQPWHSLSCLQAASTFGWSEAALLSASSCRSPSMGSSFYTSLSVSSCYLPPVSTVTFSPFVLSFLEKVGFKFMSGQGQSPALWGMSTGTAHMPDHFSFPLAFTVTRLREWKPHLDYSLWYLLWYHNTGKNRRFLPQHRRQQHVPAGLPPGLSFASSITK